MNVRFTLLTQQEVENWYDFDSKSVGPFNDIIK